MALIQNILDFAIMATDVANQAGLPAGAAQSIVDVPVPQFHAVLPAGKAYATIAHSLAPAGMMAALRHD